MISIKEAYEIALGYFSKNEGKTFICEAYDAGDVWIFFGGKTDAPEYGSVDITVCKSDGVIAEFILPSSENLELLKKAQELDVPPEYSINRV